METTKKINTVKKKKWPADFTNLKKVFHMIFKRQDVNQNQWVIQTQCV